MFFDYSRVEGFPTHFGPNHTPVTVDVLLAGFILAAVILAVSFFVSILTVQTDKTIYLYIRVTISILIGVMIILGNFGQDWEIGDIKTHTPYKAGNGDEIYAKVGLKIGLRSVNVTLKSIGAQNRSFGNETINYNERFYWTWDQGRFGFGPYAGLLQRQFRKAQYRGTPLPILWIVDYFVIDGEGFRFGRFYRTAGWYCHIAMWSAFPCWLLANICFRSVVRYGGYFLGISGCLQLTANLLWLVIRNPNPLVIPFNDDTIRTHFGPSYWLTFSCGIICILLCIIITICEHFFNTQLHIFFGVNPISIFNEKYITSEEEMEMNKEQVHSSNGNVNTRHRRTIMLDRGKSMIIHVNKSAPVYGNIGAPGSSRDPQEQIYENNINVIPKRNSEVPQEETTYDQVSLLNPIQSRPLPPLPPRRRR